MLIKDWALFLLLSGMLGSGCATPTAKALKSVAGASATHSGRACPVTIDNPDGIKRTFDSTKYLCTDNHPSSCFQAPDPVQERACDRAAATKKLQESEHCRLPTGARFVYLVEGGYVPLSDATSGQRISPTPDGQPNPDYGEPIVPVCGSLP
jgi:hypothetical protein